MPTAQYQTQIQRMLEDMYKRNAGTGSNEIQDALRRLAVSSAAQDASYTPTVFTPDAPNKGRGSQYPGLQVPTPPKPLDSYYDSRYTYTPRTVGGNGDAISTANAFEARLAAAAKANPAGIQTSPLIQDLIKKQAAAKATQPHSMADDLEAQLNALFNKPDRPGQWISPYSQEYLNQLGTRLGEAGSAGQQAFNGAKQDIIDNYGRGVTNRAQAEGGIFNDLAANAKNIGVDYAGGSLGQQAIQDQNYLNQTAGLNQANDLSFNDKLGAMVAQLGNTLGMQAKEGLLTPKQWDPGGSGLTSGDQARIGFLTDKWNRILDQEDAASKNSAQQDAIQKMMTQLTLGADEKSLQKNPLIPDTIAQILDPTVKNRAQTMYDAAGGDPATVLQNIQSRLGELPNVSNPRYTAPGSSRPTRTNEDYAQAARDFLGSRGLPTPGGITTQANLEERNTLNNLTELFRQLSPTWTGVPVSRETSSSSTAKAPVGLDPALLALYLKAGMIS